MVVQESDTRAPRSIDLLLSKKPEYPQIERRETLSPEEFEREFVANNRPVVFQIPRWKLRWTPDLLREKLGDTMVHCESGDDWYKGSQQRQFVFKKFSELLDTVLSASLEHRLRLSNFFTVEALREELDRDPPYAGYFQRVTPEGDFVRYTFRNVFWITPRGNYSSIHHDGPLNNLNLQIYGRKHFVLLDPVSRCAVPGDNLFNIALNPYDPTPAGLEVLHKAKVYEATLDPGEMIYIPKFWWHGVLGLDTSININTWTSLGGVRPWKILRNAGMPLDWKLKLLGHNPWFVFRYATSQYLQHLQTRPQIVGGT